MNTYPECEKLAVVAPNSQKIGDFLNWCETENMFLMRIDADDEIMNLHEPLQVILARYFDIDMEKVEIERQQILDDIRTGG